MIKLFTILAFAGLILNPALADRAVNRKDRQQKRIDKGVETGQLNYREAGRLERGQKRVERSMDRAERDGVVTTREANRIERQQDRQSKRIYNQKHDNDVR